MNGALSTWETSEDGHSQYSEDLSLPSDDPDQVSLPSNPSEHSSDADTHIEYANDDEEQYQWNEYEEEEMEEEEKNLRRPEAFATDLFFGRDTMQVPIRRASRREYITLVLSHKEFECMAVHIPHYDEMRPTELVQQIRYQMKESDRKDRARWDDLNNQLGHKKKDETHIIMDAYKDRIEDLEREVYKLQVRLRATQRRQSVLEDENKELRTKVEEAEVQWEDYDALYIENDMLRKCLEESETEKHTLIEQVAHIQDEATSMSQEIQSLQSTVVDEHEEVMQLCRSSMQQILSTSQSREKALKANYEEEKKKRREMTEKYYEVSGRIRVFCRLRPPVDPNDVGLLLPKQNTVVVEKSMKEFSFDQVFNPHSLQTDVYKQVEPLVLSFADGYNACILAYGQTGSGKTYTMMGEPSSQGVIPRALQHVFAIVEDREMTYMDNLAVSMVEIYNEKVLDLLTGTKGAVVRNETEMTHRSVAVWSDVNDILEEGNANRNIAATEMNVESSRSHALVFLHLESQHRETQEKRTSTLCLVDLAGSERISRSRVQGERLKETQHINKSLAALGDVINALQNKSKHTPYRNSKLTFMLRDMLSGKAKVLLMLQLSPEASDVEETTCSLQFGARASQVQMGAVQQSAESGELFKLKANNSALANRLKESQEQLDRAKEECKEKEEAASLAEERCDRLRLQLQQQQQSSEVASVVSATSMPEHGLRIDTDLSTDTVSPPVSPDRLSIASTPAEASFAPQTPAGSRTPNRPKGPKPGVARSRLAARYATQEETDPARRRSLSSLATPRSSFPSAPRETPKRSSREASVDNSTRRPRPAPTRRTNQTQSPSMSRVNTTTATGRPPANKEKTAPTQRTPLRRSSSSASSTSATSTASSTTANYKRVTAKVDTGRSRLTRPTAASSASTTAARSRAASTSASGSTWK